MGIKTPSKFAIFFLVKSTDFRFVTWSMPFLKFDLPRLWFEVFLTKTKTDLFWAISVSSKRNVKSNDFELTLSRQTFQKNHFLNYTQGTVWALSDTQRPLRQFSNISKVSIIKPKYYLTS